MSETLSIYAVSDSTGETAHAIVRAVCVQFAGVDFHIDRFSFVRNRPDLDVIIEAARGKPVIMVATIVDPELRLFLLSKSMQVGIKVVDLLFPLLETISGQLGQRPNAVAGLLRQLDNDYFTRISAMEFAVRHDDGLGMHDLQEADLVLLGISRTSKTPLSMYLAQKGHRVANIPLVPNTQLPAEIFQIDQSKIIGLTIDPNRLAEIRRARVHTLGQSLPTAGDYADIARITDEVEWSRELFKKNRRWPIIDVTGKALEENAVEIEKVIQKRKNLMSRI